jgi:hypothetical protein
VDINGSLRQEVHSCSNIGENVGCDEYITQRHGKFCQLKAAGSWWSALDLDLGFGGLLQRTLLPNITSQVYFLKPEVATFFEHLSPCAITVMMLGLSMSVKMI